MLKAEDFIYETQNLKIIYPNQELKMVIIEELNKYTDKDGEFDLENLDFKLFLLQTLVDSENEEYQFTNLTTNDLKEIEENPSFEYETILYFIGNIVSDLIASIYRSKVMELRDVQMKILQNEAIRMTEEITNDLNFLARNEKKIEDEKRILKIRQEKGLDKIEKELNKTFSKKKK